MAPHRAAEVKNLDSIVTTALTLLGQLQDALSKIHKAPKRTSTSEELLLQTLPGPGPSVNALGLARNCAMLVRAQSTKIALLIVNEPFSPRPVASIVADLINGPVPGLAAACQHCLSHQYTYTVRKELAGLCKQVLLRLADFLRSVPLNGKALPPAKRDNPTVGLLWNACDAVTNLGEIDVGGHFAKTIGYWKATLKDICIELKDWASEEPEEDDADDGDGDGGDDVDGDGDDVDGDGDDVDDDGDDDGDDGDDGDDDGDDGDDDGDDGDDDGDDDNDDDDDDDEDPQQVVDRYMDGPRPIPLDDPDEIRPRLNVILQRIGLLTLFFDAAIKRRCHGLPPLPPTTPAAASVVSRLDSAAACLEKLPEKFEDVVHALYHFDTDRVDASMDRCLCDAVAAADHLKLGWDGAADDFSRWVAAFQKHIKRNGLQDGYLRVIEPIP